VDGTKAVPWRAEDRGVTAPSDAVFGGWVDKARAWLAEVGEELDCVDVHATHAALRGALHALRDRLPVGEASQLGAQLPVILRGVYYEGWRPAGERGKERHLEPFLDRLHGELRGYEETLDAERCARSVFRVLARHVSAGEIADVVQALPADVRALWPER
jgi:uncharacterized protein (DUF2267 family)